MKSFITGLKITLKHFLRAFSGTKRKANFPSEKAYFDEKNNEGIFTLHYPHEAMLVPENARYELHNEIDDCILCDKCAEICPVNCIDIEAVRSPEPVGYTSDGTSVRFYAAKFDIDMAKCCFCGLCTVVCPTECLTMTPNYDVTSFSLAEMNYQFGKMMPDEIELRKKEWEEFQQNKKKTSEEKTAETAENKPSETSKSETENPQTSEQTTPKPKLKIKIQPKKTDE